MPEIEQRFLNCISASRHGEFSKIIYVNVVSDCHQCSEHHSCQYWVDLP